LQRENKNKLNSTARRRKKRWKAGRLI
jgi:hypothetical protein